MGGCHRPGGLTAATSNGVIDLQSGRHGWRVDGNGVGRNVEGSCGFRTALCPDALPLLSVDTSMTSAGRSAGRRRLEELIVLIPRPRRTITCLAETESVAGAGMLAVQRLLVCTEPPPT